MPIVDTHQDLIYPDRYPDAWTAEIPERNEHPRRPGDYLRSPEKSGMVATFFVEATGLDPTAHDAWVSISRAVVAGESDSNQRKLFSENAARIYSLDEATGVNG